jgi:hypothetical protein
MKRMVLITALALLVFAAAAGRAADKGECVYPVVTSAQYRSEPVDFEDFRGQVVVIWFYSDFKS